MLAFFTLEKQKMTFLIVGLGNVGQAYENTRHNAGFWFVQAFADKHNISLSHDKKFHGMVGRGTVAGVDVRLLMPDTLMNLSGKAVAPMVKFFDIAPSQLLVAHDELDIEVGAVKLKTGGGHGGHNGLRDIVPHTGADFHRLRIGIGRPVHGTVSDFVLGKPTAEQKTAIDNGIAHALAHIELAIKGDMEKARNYINAYKP